MVCMLPPLSQDSTRNVVVVVFRLDALWAIQSSSRVYFRVQHQQEIMQCYVCKVLL